MFLTTYKLFLSLRVKHIWKLRKNTALIIFFFHVFWGMSYIWYLCAHMRSWNLITMQTCLTLFFSYHNLITFQTFFFFRRHFFFTWFFCLSNYILSSLVLDLRNSSRRPVFFNVNWTLTWKRLSLKVYQIEQRFQLDFKKLIPINSGSWLKVTKRKFSSSVSYVCQYLLSIMQRRGWKR